MSRWQRISQFAQSASWCLQQLRGPKSSTTKLPVELLQVKSLSYSRAVYNTFQQLINALNYYHRDYLLGLSNVYANYFIFQDVDGMGAAGTIAKVNHGYARNYLIPNKLAAVRRGKQAGSVAAVQVESSIASAATGGAPSSALTEEEREKLVVAQQRRRLESAVKKLTTQTLVRI